MADPGSVFSRFMGMMNQEAAGTLVRKINTFMRDFKSRPVDPDQDSRYFQDFMVHMEGAMAKHPLWAGVPPAEFDGSVEALERYLMTKLYDRAFACTAEEVERDQLLSVRMSALQFLAPEHLEIPAHVMDDQKLAKAVHELSRLNLFKAPKDKLVVMLNSCAVVNDMLASTSKADGIGADDFTPLLIYVVIKAQPQHFASNLAYIERFHMASRLVSEAQYYFTQLCSAATFIEMVHAGSFKVSADEFLANMLAAGALTDEQLALMQQPASPFHPGSKAEAPAAAAAAAAADAAPPLTAVAATAAAAAAAAAAAGRPSAGIAMQALPVGRATLQPDASCIDAAPGFLPPMTVEELAAQGATLLSSKGASSRLAEKHPYAFASMEGLTLGDVALLLTAYKELVLQHECLAAALRWHAANSRQGSGAAPASKAAGAGAAAAAAAGAAASSALPLAAPPASATGDSRRDVQGARLSAGSSAAAPPAPAADAAAPAASTAGTATVAAAAAPAAVGAPAPTFIWPDDPSPAPEDQEPPAVPSSSSSSGGGGGGGAADAAPAAGGTSPQPPASAAGAREAQLQAATSPPAAAPPSVDELLAELVVSSGPDDAARAADPPPASAGTADAARHLLEEDDMFAGLVPSGSSSSHATAATQQQQQQQHAVPSLLD